MAAVFEKVPDLPALVSIRTTVVGDQYIVAVNGAHIACSCRKVACEHLQVVIHRHAPDAAKNACRVTDEALFDLSYGDTIASFTSLTCLMRTGRAGSKGATHMRQAFQGVTVFRASAGMTFPEVGIKQGDRFFLVRDEASGHFCAVQWDRIHWVCSCGNRKCTHQLIVNEFLTQECMKRRITGDDFTAHIEDDLATN